MSSKQERQMKLITELGNICEELGWVIAIPASDDPNQDMVPGLIIGTTEFVSEIAMIVAPGENIDDVLEVYEKGNEKSLEDEQMNQLPPKSKKNTLH